VRNIKLLILRSLMLQQDGNFWRIAR